VADGARPADLAEAPEASYLQVHAEEIAAAARRIAPHVRRTPLLTTDLDPRLRLKPECFQVTGSFKVRGAFNAVLQLNERTPPPRGVIAVSSGNHAQALALAARTAGLTALILIPEDANPAKVAATRALGAEVLQEGVTFENREQRLREVMAERGLTLVHPFDDWEIIHGQATAARELLEDDPEVGAILAPTGGGGLLSGTALAAKIHRRDTLVIGVEPERADDAQRSFRSGAIQTLPGSPQTLADGVRTTAIGRRNFEVMVERRLVDDIVTVSEEEIERALVTAWLKLKLALEPTAALPLAAYLAGKAPAAEASPVGLILSGGNFDQAVVARLLGSA
jgi:threonine dehydratase